jgi:hypothetical protein
MAAINDGIPNEREAVRTTIVGGRPPGSGKSNGRIPRGIEVLVKKASVDAAFCEVLLSERAEAAARIDLELDTAEAAMLSAIPESQLIGIIHNTKVGSNARPAFMGYAAAAMLAALGVTAGGATEAGATEPPADNTLGDYYEEPDVRMAIQPDYDPDIEPMETGVIEGFAETYSGVVVADVTVFVLGTDFYAESDDEGYFRIEGLPPGVYTVEIRDEEGTGIGTTTVTVIGGVTTHADFTANINEMATGSRPDLP